MLTFNEIKKGKIIVIEGQPYQVTSAQFSRKQASRPVMRTTLRHVANGKTSEHTFHQADKVEEADMARTTYQFLYKNVDMYVFMNNETYEQVELGEDILGDSAKFLLEGQEGEVLLFENKPIGFELPIKIDRKVIEAPPGVKGDTSTNVTKDIVIEGNVKMKAPLFIKEGDLIKIDTRVGEYIERA